MNRYLVFALGLLALVVVLAPQLDHLAHDSGAAGSSDAALSSVPAQPVAAPIALGGTTAIDRDSSGEFHIDAMVDGQPLHMLIDTGANGVALSEADANAIGITVDPSLYRQVVNTASGPGYGAHVRIDRLEVAGHDLGAVDAVVVRGLGTSLLGQSVLRRVGTITISGDRMIIGE